MKKQLRLMGMLLLMAAIHSCQAQTATELHLLTTFHLSGTGGWDYLAIQPGSNKLYVSHATQVNIVNKTTGDSLGVIPNTTGVHGITFVPNLKKGYTTNGGLNTLSIFDLQTDKVLGQLSVGENPDAIMYDEYSKRLIVCNGRSHTISIVDPEYDKVVGIIDVGGKPEEAVTNGAGTLFVNIEDKNEIVVIDLKSKQVLHHWALDPGEAPTGLAIDNITHRLFSACSESSLLIVLDAVNGAIISKIPIGAGCDGVVFDKVTKCIYASNGEGNLTVIKEEGNDKYSKIATLPTKRGARTIALDETTHKLYLPTAEFETTHKLNSRPTIIPNTFQVLVLGK
ncbi:MULTISPECIES: YncE family protein [Niastella]|uniref:YncE family protein n=1 Tax=Niastella soli TaxID=2821487 RepID=A0ABS3YY62_9BACT|nr:YncE family protein [Niastella soli]MBO9202866.1 YncE family protein [Niastella soli]